MIFHDKKIEFKEPDIIVHSDILLSDEFSEDIKESGDRFVCRSCNNFITKSSWKYFIDETWEHFFTNPAYRFFHVRTFKQAPGCITMGEYALEYTWFKNFPWKYALCSNCHKHLGWHYAYKDYQFYGLIADELIFVTEGDTQ